MPDVMTEASYEARCEVADDNHASCRVALMARVEGNGNMVKR